MELDDSLMLYQSIRKLVALPCNLLDEELMFHQSIRETVTLPFDFLAWRLIRNSFGPKLP